jgi:hypothetical protein
METSVFWLVDPDEQPIRAQLFTNYFIEGRSLSRHKRGYAIIQWTNFFNRVIPSKKCSSKAPSKWRNSHASTYPKEHGILLWN